MWEGDSSIHNNIGGNHIKWKPKILAENKGEEDIFLFIQLIENY